MPPILYPIALQWSEQTERALTQQKQTKPKRNLQARDELPVWLFALGNQILYRFEVFCFDQFSIIKILPPHLKAHVSNFQKGVTQLIVTEHCTV